MRIYNNYKAELEPFFKKRFVIVDPCSEITYYKWENNRQDYIREDIHPKFKEVLKEATTKNYASVWLDAFEDRATQINFVEKTLERQSPFTTGFAITPVLETSSPNALINLAFELNEEACSICQNLDKPYLGCYVSLHSSLFTNDPRAQRKLNYIATKIMEVLKKYDNVYIFLKLIDLESSASYDIEKTHNLVNLIETMNKVRGSEYINGHNFLMQISGLTKKFMVVLGKGADCAVELMNGKNKIEKPTGFNIKNRKQNFMFGNFYDMINQIMISYDSLMGYWKKNKALPSYTEVSQKVTDADLTNHIRYAKIKRLNQIEARCLEVEQFKKDILEGLNRGLQDRLARSTDIELQQLSKLF